MNDYTQFARFYDDFIDEQFLARLVEVLKHYSRRYPPPGRRMLDLACGTGTVAMRFAQDGWAVTGLDLSDAMLEKARAKASAAGLDVALQRGDMRRFTVDEPVDLVTCNSDSINHLADEDDLAATFSCVVGALAPGGVFVFDVNTPYTLRTKWSDHTMTGRRGLIAYRWEHTFDETARMGTLDATFKVRSNGHYLTFTERFCERAFETDRIDALLGTAELELLEAADFFTLVPLHDESVRATFVAAKRV